MLTVNQSAWDRLQHLQSTKQDVSALRLTYSNGKIKCRRGTARKSDLVIEHPGRPTLLMTRAVAKDLAEKTLDTAETKRGPRPKLRSADERLK